MVRAIDVKSVDAGSNPTDCNEVMKVNKITIYRANARVAEEAGLQNQ